MSAPRIISGAAVRDYGIDAGERADPPPKISFSFQYWNEMRFFSLSDVEMPWAHRLFARMREISRFTREEWDAEVALNRRAANRWHYHEVDWTAHGIPIEKYDINWVPKQILDNEGDFAFYQFGLGRDGGRVAGFWEKPHRFAIVLFDPNHSLQPSKDYGYEVVDCEPHPEPGALVRLAVDQVRSELKCSKDECEVHAALTQITVKNVDRAYGYRDLAFLGLDERDQKNVADLLGNRRAKSINEIFKFGVEALMAQWAQDLDAEEPKQ